MKKKLQIFVSSTYKDLIDERQAAVEAILKSGNIPAGMELFTSGNESQLQVITRWIDESDIYLLILGGRYGTIETNSGQSYTELEYDYAVSQGKPYFSIVISDLALDLKVRQYGQEVLEIENAVQYKKFREKVLTKMSSFFSEAKDIKLVIHETVQEFKEHYEFSGWVSGKTLDEIDLLRNENQQLRKQIEELQKKQYEIKFGDPSEAESEEFSRIEEIFNKEVIDKFIDETGKEYTLLEIVKEYKAQLVAGFHNNWQLNNIGKLFLFNILPRLAIHGLAVMNKIPTVPYKHFALNEKGCRFIAYLEKKELE
jgi:hypothetical protein